MRFDGRFKLAAKRQGDRLPSPVVLAAEEGAAASRLVISVEP